MVLHKTIKTLIFVFFITNCYAKANEKPRVLKILKRGNKVVLENDNSGNFNPKELLKFVQNYADMEYNIKNILNKTTLGKNPDGKHPLGMKRILAKRIVSPGQKTPDLEYDKQYETYFKPLVKIRKLKKMDKQRADLDVLSDIYTSSSSSESDESAQYIKTYDIDGLTHRDLLKLKGEPKENKESQIINRKQKDMRMSIEEQGARFLKDIQQMTHTIKDTRQKKIIKDKVFVVVQELEELHGLLFDLIYKSNNLREKTIIDENILEIPATNQEFNNIFNENTEHHKTPAYIPHNTLWNFWTVRQTIKL